MSRAGRSPTRRSRHRFFSAELLVNIAAEVAWREGMSDLHSTYTPVLLVVFIAMALAGLFPAKALGQTFGTVSLKEGESRRISIGPTFRDMRVCNDLKSAGSVMIKVGAG